MAREWTTENNPYLQLYEHYLEFLIDAQARSCVLCIPPSTALLAQRVTLEDLKDHTVMSTGEDADSSSFVTLNGHPIRIHGTTIHYREQRQCQLVLSERMLLPTGETHVTPTKSIQLWYIHRPFVGGLPQGQHRDQHQHLLALLRSYPDSALAFQTLSASLSWLTMSLHGSQLDYQESHLAGIQHRVRAQWQENVSHFKTHEYILPREQSIDQVIESYMMERLFHQLFPVYRRVYEQQDQVLREQIFGHQLRHFTCEDLGITPKHFQIEQLQAKAILVNLRNSLHVSTNSDNSEPRLLGPSPMEILLTLSDITRVIEEELDTAAARRPMDSSALHYITTDDLLDQLLYLVLQVPDLPYVALIHFLNAYHFVNSESTALGYIKANFQLVIEWYQQLKFPSLYPSHPLRSRNSSIVERSALINRISHALVNQKTSSPLHVMTNDDCLNSHVRIQIYERAIPIMRIDLEDDEKPVIQVACGTSECYCITGKQIVESYVHTMLYKNRILRTLDQGQLYSWKLQQASESQRLRIEYPHFRDKCIVQVRENAANSFNKSNTNH